MNQAMKMSVERSCSMSVVYTWGTDTARIALFPNDAPKAEKNCTVCFYGVQTVKVKAFPLQVWIGPEGG
jgi:hypothetical protein